MGELHDAKPNVKSAKNIFKYIFISAVASVPAAVIVAYGLDVFMGTWIPGLFWIVLLNDFCFPVLLGLPVFIILTSDDVKIEIIILQKRIGTESGKPLIKIYLFDLCSDW